jgi:hypothetical protein
MAIAASTPVLPNQKKTVLQNRPIHWHTVLYYNIMGPPSYMRSVVNWTVVRRRIPVFTTSGLRTWGWSYSKQEYQLLNLYQFPRKELLYTVIFHTAPNWSWCLLNLCMYVCISVQQFVNLGLTVVCNFILNSLFPEKVASHAACHRFISGRLH